MVRSLTNIHLRFGGSGEGDDFLGGAAPVLAQNPPESKPQPIPESKPLVDEPVGPNEVLDEAIKKAIICGEFEAAVDCCFKFGRMADALLLAATGGKELFQRTQERYLQLHEAQPFVKITRSIVNHQLQSLVSCSQITLSYSTHLMFSFESSRLRELVTFSLSSRLSSPIQRPGRKH